MPHTPAVLKIASTKLMRADYVEVFIYQFSPFIPDKNKHVVSDQTYNCPRNRDISILCVSARDRHASHRVTPSTMGSIGTAKNEITVGRSNVVCSQGTEKLIKIKCVG